MTRLTTLATLASLALSCAGVAYQRGRQLERAECTADMLSASEAFGAERALLFDALLRSNPQLALDRCRTDSECEWAEYRANQTPAQRAGWED